MHLLFAARKVFRIWYCYPQIH